MDLDTADGGKTAWWLPVRYADRPAAWKAGYRLGLEGRPPSDSGFTEDDLIRAAEGVRQAWLDMEAAPEIDWAAQAKHLLAEDRKTHGVEPPETPLGASLTDGKEDDG